MNLGEQKANNLQNIGTEFENFLKQHPKTKAKSQIRNAELVESKRNGLKEICLKYGVDFNKVYKIFITN